ncbi:MAG: penicillin acylase family protein [Planctomycetota bacterium]
MEPDIWRDEHGVPHVLANDRRELYWGQGVVHATDRGLQMLLTRIIVQGRTSELLTATDQALHVDKFFRKMNWHGGEEPSFERLGDAERECLQAYCDGANHVFSKRVPWELRLLRYHHEPWTPWDMCALSRLIGYVMLQQCQATIERLLIEMIQAGVERPALEELFPGLLQNADFDLLRQVKLGERVVPPEVTWCGSAMRMMGSNNWAVSGDRTASGHAFLCNDPHLEGNRLPNAWSEIVLRVGDRYMAGGSMPGAPGVIIGRNNDVAWGATYTFADAVDSWVERCKDGHYFREPDQWVPFHRRQETILRKGKTPVTIVFHENDHGVLDGDPHVENLYLATRWAAAKSGPKTLGLLFQLWDVGDVEQARGVLGQFETSWNFVIADRHGNIGYQMSGLIPRRGPSQQGFVPLPGWKPENDWQGFERPEDLPRELNPSGGFIVTANNDLNSLGQASPSNMPMGPYRAERIAEVLGQNSSCTLADMQALQFDLRSAQAARFMEYLKPVLPSTEQGDILRHWDFTYTENSLGAFLFEQFYHALTREVFGTDMLGEAVVDYLAAETGTFMDFFWNFDRILLAETSVWFRRRNRQQLYQEVAERALNVEPRPWGEGRQYLLGHLLLAGRLPRLFGFDRGPITATGNRATVHQGQICRRSGRLTTFVPSFRLVTDMGENCLWTTLLGGPSDRRFSRWYCSDLSDWLQGRYKPIGPQSKPEKRPFP